MQRVKAAGLDGQMIQLCSFECPYIPHRQELTFFPSFPPKIIWEGGEQVDGEQLPLQKDLEKYIGHCVHVKYHFPICLQNAPTVIIRLCSFPSQS